MKGVSATDVNLDAKRLRVCLQQPALPQYRIRFFESIADHPRIDLEILYGNVDSVKNVSSEHLNATFQPTTKLPLGLLWNRHHLSAIDRRKFDVTVYSANIHYLSLLAGILLSRIRGVPVVAWGHFRSKKENSLRRALRTFFARFADSILCYDESGRSALIERGLPGERVFISPNSIDIEAMVRECEHATESGKANEWYRRLQLVRGKTLIFASRLVAHKKIDFVLSVFAIVLRHEPEASLIVLGDGPERQRLEEFAECKGISSRVHFVGETYDDAEVATYFSVSDMMLYPTNLGLSLMVAAATNTAIVTESNLEKHGPEASWLMDGKNAILVSEMSAERFAEATLGLMRDTEMKSQVAQCARVEVLERYGISRMVDGFVRAVDFAATRRSGGKLR